MFFAGQEIATMPDLFADLDQEAFGFDVERPVGAWNKQLEVDYPGVFRALLKATVGYWTGNAPSTVSSAVDAAFAFKITDKLLPPAVLGWHLIRRTLARAMAKLTVEALKAHDVQPDDPEALVADWMPRWTRRPYGSAKISSIIRLSCRLSRPRKNLSKIGCAVLV